AATTTLTTTSRAPTTTRPGPPLQPVAARLLAIRGPTGYGCPGLSRRWFGADTARPAVANSALRRCKGLHGRTSRPSPLRVQPFRASAEEIAHDLELRLPGVA